jgi:hypothetical protein
MLGTLYGRSENCQQKYDTDFKLSRWFLLNVIRPLGHLPRIEVGCVSDISEV